ncbi:MAG: helix-turn-helix transcriptional regulator [Bacteroidota bacterium]|nr:helix-turn-helix transcriptional regulator [Bacteroidota bacterium]MDP4231504.1 helix-turn-helix transcriptional regulator [Bacteroidota bacterium]MDP4237118.1 helix-turn-helix transcriptional regulator [Bacteroidota bacterium]
MILRKVIGANIKRLRKLKGWSQEKLSVRSRLSLNFVGSLERGRVNVSADSLERIAKSLQVEVEELVRKN